MSSWRGSTGRRVDRNIASAAASAGGTGAGEAAALASTRRTSRYSGGTSSSCTVPSSNRSAMTGSSGGTGFRGCRRISSSKASPGPIALHPRPLGQVLGQPPQAAVGEHAHRAGPLADDLADLRGVQARRSPAAPPPRPGPAAAPRSAPAPPGSPAPRPRPRPGRRRPAARAAGPAGRAVPVGVRPAGPRRWRASGPR